MGGGVVSLPARFRAHAVQSSHHDPLWLSADARHSAAAGRFLRATSCRALGPGGLTMELA
jgi:hypothetical protein